MILTWEQAAERITTRLMCDGQVQETEYRSDSPQHISSEMPAEDIAQEIALDIDQVIAPTPVLAIGVGIPGFVRHGIVE
jgi:predicted NBD/HSP70 family sugar kinase